MDKNLYDEEMTRYRFLGIFHTCIFVTAVLITYMVNCGIQVQNNALPVRRFVL